MEGYRSRVTRSTGVQRSKRCRYYAGSPCSDFGAFVFDDVDVFHIEMHQRGIRPDNRGEMREIDLQTCPEVRDSERLTGLSPAKSR